MEGDDGNRIPVDVALPADVVIRRDTQRRGLDTDIVPLAWTKMELVLEESDVLGIQITRAVGDLDALHDSVWAHGTRRRPRSRA
jgi:hypothetical protein